MGLMQMGEKLRSREEIQGWIRLCEGEVVGVH